jgi:phosphotransferase system enzyme I (PtsI)
VDAAAGVITVDPEDTTLAETRALITTLSAETAVPFQPGVLADGTAVPLLANLGSVSAVAEAIHRGAEGVGLFRTEFLFLNATTAPSVAEQREHYTRLLAAFPGRTVVVRALDVGADKPLTFLNTSIEKNPALGLRGLRALRANEQILRDQLTALAGADASTDANLWVMAPMVATVEETRYFTRIAREAGLRTTGVMMEVPSAALLAD